MKKTLSLLFVFSLLLAGCGDHRSEREESMNTEQIQFPMPQGGKVEYTGHGNEVWFAYGAMAGVEDVKANGVAQAHKFDDGRYLHTVNLNIEPAADGYFYEGWLVNGPSVVSTGHLTNNFSDARHSLRFESDTDYTDYLNVIITLEPDDGNPAPADHVAEGKLKVTKR